MLLIFDIGMFDGADTAYYLSEGYKVIAVEANINLTKKAEILFKDEVASGQLVLVNRAISNNSDEEITLTISGDDLGSSSTIDNKIAHKNPLGVIKVKTITILELIKQYGQPHFIKVDIEGADRFCILPLNKQVRPQYISFEAGSDIEELVKHLSGIGYTRFKAINQCNFNELNNQEKIVFRLKRKILHLLGYKDPALVRKNGRFFKLDHSAGPAPWCSDGSWQTSDNLMAKWHSMAAKNRLGGWYDIHAM